MSSTVEGTVGLVVKLMVAKRVLGFNSNRAS